jgi:hypothetical protein
MTNKKISALTSASTPLAGTETLPIVQSGSTTKVAVSDLTAGRTVAMAALGVGTAATGTRLVNILSTTGVSPLVAVGPNGYVAVDNAGGGINYYSSNVSHVFEGVSGGNIVTFDSITKNVTMVSGNVSVNTAAKGVNFPANTPKSGMTSQLLNWYEEGTYTPVQSGLVVVGSATLTGTYTRIGRQVFYSIKISSTGTTACTAGAVTITLPFTKSSTSFEFGLVVIGGAIQGPIEADPGLYFYPCSWAATANVYASGTYTI